MSYYRYRTAASEQTGASYAWDVQNIQLIYIELEKINALRKAVLHCSFARKHEMNFNA
jgi:hypothetical protein